MEAGCALEGREHRHHLLQIRNHRQQFVYIDVDHMIVESEIEMVAPRGAVHGGELQFGSPAYESHLVENQRTVLDIEPALEILGVLVEYIHRTDMGSQRQIDVGRNEERIAFSCWTALLLDRFTVRPLAFARCRSFFF